MRRKKMIYSKILNYDSIYQYDHDIYIYIYISNNNYSLIY